MTAVAQALSYHMRLVPAESSLTAFGLLCTISKALTFQVMAVAGLHAQASGMLE